MLTIGECLTKIEALSSELRRDCLDLLAWVLCKPSSTLPLYASELVSEEHRLKFDRCMNLRLSECPFAYITGGMTFLGCNLTITPSVLIPRPETELLADLTLQYLRQKPTTTVVDLCSGSGCIGLAIKKHAPKLRVILSDISQEACALAQMNAHNNQLDVEVVRGDFFTPLKGVLADIIICNPPYLTEEEFSFCPLSVQGYEPKLALVAGVSGLEYYEKLEKEAPEYLTPGGLIAMEIGAAQGKDIQRIFSQSPWKNSKLKKDFANLDRFFLVEFHP